MRRGFSVIGCLLASLCFSTLTVPAATPFTETFTSGGNGWAFSTNNSNYRITNGAARIRFGGGVPSPTPVVLIGSNTASAGAFTGNYWSAGIIAVGFSVYATSAIPDQFSVQLDAGAENIRANIGSSICRTQEWLRIVLPVSSALTGGWIESPPGCLTSALAAVTAVRLQIIQNAQFDLNESYVIDDVSIASQTAIQLISPASYAFGHVLTGTVSQTSILITNAGNLSMTGVVDTGSSVFTVAGPSSYALAPGATTNILINFQSTSAATHNAKIALKSDGGTRAFIVSGTTLRSPSAALAPTSRDFGTVVTGRSAAASFAITNSGGSTLTGQVSVAEQGFAISNGTNFTLNAGQSRSIAVSFLPPAAGSYSGVVLITTSDQILTGLVSGIGFDGPILGLSPSSIDLGPVANNLSSDAVFVVTNSGSQLLTGSAVAEGDPFAIAGSDVYELLPGGSTQIVVRFAPISPEFYTNRIEFLSDGGSATGLVTGIGSNLPVMVVSPVSYDYGSVVTGTMVSATFTVSNRGMAVMNSGEVSVPGPAFQITGGANFSDMVEGDVHTVTIRFAPLALQTYSNLATFESNAGLIQIPLIGEGVSLDIPALLGVSPAGYNFGSIAALSSSQTVFVVTNSGTLAMTGTASLVSSTFTIVSGSSFVVSGGGSTNVVVQFTPGYAGSYTADLIFESSGGGFTGALYGAGFLSSGGSTNLFYGATGGVFHLVFQLPAGTWYHLEATTNFSDAANWFPVTTTNYTASGTAIFNETSPAAPSRIYRIVSP